MDKPQAQAHFLIWRPARGGSTGGKAVRQSVVGHTQGTVRHVEHYTEETSTWRFNGWEGSPAERCGAHTGHSETRRTLHGRDQQSVVGHTQGTVRHVEHYMEETSTWRFNGWEGSPAERCGAHTGHSETRRTLHGRDQQSVVGHTQGTVRHVEHYTEETSRALWGTHRAQ
ncbi:hypothetical protein ACOMHN_013079 [Nucella lapillus]